MTSQWKKPATVTLMVIFIAMSVTMPVIAAGPTDPPASDEVFEVTDNVSAWERAAFPMRANETNAVYTLDNADWRVQNSDADETSLNRDPIPVYGTDEEVSIEYDSSKADKADDYFAGEGVQIVWAHIEETDNGEVPGTTSEAIDLLTMDTANENASIYSSSPIKLGSNGIPPTLQTTPRSGHTFYFMVRNESGKDGVVTNGAGELQSIDGNITVIGMEHIVARKGPASVDAPSSVTREKNASFTVDASTLQAAQNGDSIKQGVILYDENKYVQQSFTLKLDEDVNKEYDIEENSTLESDIDEVNGVARSDDKISMFGMEVGDGKVAKSADIGSLFDFVGEEAGTDMPGIEDGSPTETIVLNASSTIVNDSNAGQTVDVQTFGNWSTGEYRWVYVAVGENSEDIVTQTDTITVKKASTDNTDNTDDSDDTDDSDGTVDPVDPGTENVTETETVSEPGTPTATKTDAPTETATSTESVTSTETDTGMASDTPTPQTPTPDDGGGLPLVTIGIIVILAALAGGVYYFQGAIFNN